MAKKRAKKRAKKEGKKRGQKKRAKKRGQNFPIAKLSEKKESKLSEI